MIGDATWFGDYSTDELIEILGLMSEGQDYHFTADGLAACRRVLDAVRDESFGNARLAHNVLEEAITRHATRIVALDAPSADDLRSLTAEDVPGKV